MTWSYRSFSWLCKSEKLLLNLRKISCEVCLPDIYVVYDCLHGMAELNQQLLQMATKRPHGLKSFASGRVVVLRDGVRHHAP
jgi:hypothetical protein